MKNIIVLGSTGSIGVNTLEVASAFPDRLRVTGLAARGNIDLLEKQIERFSPPAVAVSDFGRAKELRRRVGGGVEVESGYDGVVRLAARPGTDVVVSAMVGAVGLRPTLEAIKAAGRIALANKEVLVCGGGIVMAEAARRGTEMLPIDSEHCALHQCLRAGSRGEVKRLILTASGGPFLRRSAVEMETASPEEALKHPRWRMGRKVTIDSATMMNKALEMIEARWLFDVEPDRISVIVHPESVVHSIVEFADGSLIAQMSPTDMRVAIQYALLYPERLPGPWGTVDLGALGALHFEEPDAVRFPAIRLGERAMREGGTLPAVMNAANEVAVGRFLAGEMPFTAICRCVERVMEAHGNKDTNSVDEIIAADRWAREQAREIK